MNDYSEMAERAALIERLVGITNGFLAEKGITNELKAPTMALSMPDKVDYLNLLLDVNRIEAVYEGDSLGYVFESVDLKTPTEQDCDRYSISPKYRSELKEIGDITWDYVPFPEDLIDIVILRDGYTSSISGGSTRPWPLRSFLLQPCSLRAARLDEDYRTFKVVDMVHLGDRTRLIASYDQIPRKESKA
jgi:hypothetical protein